MWKANFWHHVEDIYTGAMKNYQENFVALSEKMNPFPILHWHSALGQSYEVCNHKAHQYYIILYATFSYEYVCKHGNE